MDVVEGITYAVRIAGWDGSVGNFRLRVDSPPCGGACCLSGDCTVMTYADCVAAGGIYRGDGAPCEPDTCLCIGDMDCREGQNSETETTHRRLNGLEKEG